jgi:hypothetical protein
MKLWPLLALASCQAPATRDWVVLEGTGTVLGLDTNFQIELGAGGDGRLRTGTALGEEIVSEDGRVWSRSWNNPVRELSLAEREFSLVQFAVLSGAWKKAGSPLEATADGEDWELRLTGGHAVFLLEIDAESGDPVRLTRRDEGEMDGLAMEEWRNFDGIRAPSRLRRGSLDGVHDVLNVSSARAARAPELEPPAPAARDFSFDPMVSSTLETRRAKSGHVLVRPMVDGKDIGWFIFDSGAGAMCIDPDAARELGHDSFGKVTAVGVAGKTEAGFFRTSSFTLGPLTLKEPIFVSLELDFIGAALGEKITGIVGYEVFARSVVEFQSGAAPQLALHPRETFRLGEGSSWQSLTLDGTVPCIRTRFEGDREGIFRLDTGAGDSISFHSPAVARWQLLEGRETGTTLAGGIGGVKAIRTGELAWFELGGHRFEAVSAQFYTESEGAFADQDLDGNVGLGLLGHFKLVFDYGGGRMAFASRT